MHHFELIFFFFHIFFYLTIPFFLFSALWVGHFHYFHIYAEAGKLV